MRARTRCFRLLPVSCATCRGIAELPRVPEPTRQRPHSSSCVLQPSAETSVSIASPSLCRSFPCKVCPSRLSQFKGSLHFLCDQADGRQAQSPVSNFALDAQFSLGRRLTWADVHPRARLIATASTSFGFLPLPESYRKSNCCGRSPSDFFLLSSGVPLVLGILLAPRL